MNKYISIVFILVFLFPIVSFASIDTNLKYGSKGVEVSELQDFLISKSFLTGQTSGNFFSLTRNAVIAYQTSVGLPSTGFVGVMTREKINSELSQANTPSSIAEISESGTSTPTQDNFQITTQQQIQNLLAQISQLNSQMAKLNQNAQTQIQQTTQIIPNTPSQTNNTSTTQILQIEKLKFIVQPTIKLTKITPPVYVDLNDNGIRDSVTDSNGNISYTENQINYPAQYSYHLHFETNKPTTAEWSIRELGGNKLKPSNTFNGNGGWLFNTPATVFDADYTNIWGNTLRYGIKVDGIDIAFGGSLSPADTTDKLFYPEIVLTGFGS